ncbi:MAG: hypothetical protein K2X48_01060 [Chitinophagaceae bacterium]|nr:hypothetical protein [Chitinophagaceae bacterium]
MAEKPLTEQESLLIIQQMINRAKSNFVDTGIGPMLWGAVITICSLVQAAKIYFDLEMNFDIWLLALFALVPQVFISIKERRERKAKGWDDDIMSYVWTCFGISVFLVNFINNRISIELSPAIEAYRAAGNTIQSTWSFASCFLLLVFGFPTIITGAARKQRWMLAGGIFCWVSVIIAAFTPTYVDFMLMAFAATLSWLIPGMIIRKKYLQQKTTHV